MTKTYYFPFLEFSLLAVAIILVGIGFYKGLNHWLSILFAVFAYALTVGSSYIIRLTNEKIVITPLSPFQLKRSINLDSIIKINSQESYTLESDLTAENTYPLFKKNYCLEYLDKNERKKTVYFSINNKTKEKELMTTLNKTAKTSQ
jgi:plasmid maintenance system antidote protein VapI